MVAWMAAEDSCFLRGPANALTGPEAEDIWSTAFYVFMVTAQEPHDWHFLTSPGSYGVKQSHLWENGTLLGDPASLETFQVSLRLNTGFNVAQQQQQQTPHPQENHVTPVSFQMKCWSAQMSVLKHVQPPVTLSKLAALKIRWVTNYNWLSFTGWESHKIQSICLAPKGALRRSARGPQSTIHWGRWGPVKILNTLLFF